MASAAIVDQLKRVFHVAEREQEPFACIGIETHPPALDLLKSVVAKNIRTIDVGEYYGSQAVFVILPDTYLPGAMAVAERIAQQTQEEWTRTDLNKLKISIGISFFPNKETQHWEELLRFVEAALEQACLQDESIICLLQHQQFLRVPINFESSAG